MHDSDTILVERLTEARVFANRADPARCIVQLTSSVGDRYIDLAVNELLGLAERFTQDAILLGATKPAGVNFEAN